VSKGRERFGQPEGRRVEEEERKKWPKKTNLFRIFGKILNANVLDPGSDARNVDARHRNLSFLAKSGAERRGGKDR